MLSFNQFLTERKRNKKKACWVGYKQVGMKMKNGKEVPNCVPIDEAFDVDPNDKLKPVPTVEEIAKKHKVSVEEVEKQIKKGTDIEKEHTEDTDTAKQIAHAHVDEALDYYEKLADCVEEEFLDEMYTKPGLREKIKNRIMASSKGGKPGQWSARKSQMLVQQYEKEGGGYKSKGRSKKQRNLSRWSKTDWKTHDDKPSIQGQKHDEVDAYLPKAAIAHMKRKDKENDTNLYSKMTSQKRKAAKSNDQHADYSDDVKKARKAAIKHAHRTVKGK